jgi:hypothetical protein
MNVARNSSGHAVTTVKFFPASGVTFLPGQQPVGLFFLHGNVRVALDLHREEGESRAAQLIRNCLNGIVTCVPRALQLHLRVCKHHQHQIDCNLQCILSWKQKGNQENNVTTDISFVVYIQCGPVQPMSQV